MTQNQHPIFTIGHSNRAIGVFLGLLHAHEIARLVDVRSFPGSRRHPQFNKERLRAAFEADGIAYTHMVSLGGKRTSPDGSVSGLEAYTAYTETAPFRAALAELESLGRRERVAVMCAEALWRDCHRTHIADALARDGFEIVHIAGEKPPESAPKLPGF